MRPTLFTVVVATLGALLAGAVLAQERTQERDRRRGGGCCMRMGDMAGRDDMERMRDTSRAPRDLVQIAFRTQPDPPQSGENQIEVTVKTPDGAAVTDADVSVSFVMPAMPSMNMPEMRHTARLSQTRAGVYRGKGDLAMAGRWDVTVSVARGGQPLGSKELTVTAR